MKIRPFERHFEGRLEQPAVTMTGWIEDDSFVVRALGHTAKLTVSKTGKDHHGSYALLTGEQIVHLAGDFRLKARIEHDEDLGDGVELCLVCDREATEKARAAARANGIDPDQVNLVVVPDAGYSVYLGSHGAVDGTGRLEPNQPRRDDKPSVH